MPDPTSDADQLRFAQIMDRMFNGLVKNLPDYFLEQSGAKSRMGLRDKLVASSSIMSIIECCAYEAQCIEEEARRRVSP